MELTGANILFLSLPRHDGQYTSTPWQLAKAMATHNRVVFVDNPCTFTDAILGLKNSVIRKRLKAYFTGSSYKQDGVEVVLAPLVWPVNFLPKGKLYNFFSAWNHRMVANRVNRYLKSHHINEVVYVNSFNFYLANLHRYLGVRVSCNIYHCIDPMVKAFTLRHGRYLQPQAAAQADLIVSTAPALQREFVLQGYRNSHLVPNAANFELFHASRQVQTIHASVSVLQGKVLGYLGNIERRTDFAWLEKVVELLPDWTLVMAGPSDSQYIPASFRNHPRVKFTGAVSHHDAPTVINRFDVAMIPFLRDEVSSGIYPLKLFEYLATGKPVVSTNFNPDVLGELSAVVEVAHSPEEFAQAAERAVTTDSLEKQNERIAVAAQNTWQHRAQQFGKLITQQLQDSRIMDNTKQANLYVRRGKPSLKERIKNNPRWKRLALKILFRPKPYSSRVRWIFWLLLIFPKYFKQGVSWSSRLDLVPFNRFKIGKYSRIEMNVVINNGMGDVIIHDEVHTGIGCVIIGPVTLHKYVGLSQYVRILGMHHGSDADLPHHHQPCKKAAVVLEEDAWIGTGTVIMGKKNGEPLVIGRYSRIGANAVVMDDIPPYSVAVGSPAKVVRVWDFETRCWVKPNKSVADEVNLVGIPVPASV